jgi:hypothetical protein
MDKMKKLAFAAYIGIAVAGMSGCANTPSAGLDGKDEAMAPVGATQAAEHKVSRALPSYGSMGGYRYRRFAAVAAAS